MLICWCYDSWTLCATETKGTFRIMPQNHPMVQHRCVSRLAKTYLPAKGSDLSEEEAIRPVVHGSSWRHGMTYGSTWHGTIKAQPAKENTRFIDHTAWNRNCQHLTITFGKLLKLSKLMRKQITWDFWGTSPEAHGDVWPTFTELSNGLLDRCFWRESVENEANAFPNVPTAMQSSIFEIFKILFKHR